jgi:hypothetical protein
MCLIARGSNSQGSHLVSPARRRSKAQLHAVDHQMERGAVELLLMRAHLLLELFERFAGGRGTKRAGAP